MIFFGNPTASVRECADSLSECRNHAQGYVESFSIALHNRKRKDVTPQGHTIKLLMLLTN